MITNRIIQAWFDKANASGTDIMRWSDFLEALAELKNTDTTVYTENPLRLSGIEEYADDDAAETGGLTGDELYRTSTGETRVKLPEILP